MIGPSERRTVQFQTIDFAAGSQITNGSSTGAQVPICVGAQLLSSAAG
jgi:hypothetical protein